ncbi:MAG TPA: S8 family serine peptidase, partial [Gemmatimonadaceae bacterium]|nr:S8 family serine peptidase [Gemmatimonadaceae bacterium]
VKVTVFGTDTTRALAGFSGTANLSISGGTIEPNAVILNGGTGTVQARVTGVTGEVTITATVVSLAHSRVLAVAGELLPGNPGDPAATAIPRRSFEVRPQDYSLTHPHFTGVPFSFNTLVLIFRLGTTVGEANQVLAEAGARIVGGIPGTSTVRGILQLRLPTTTHEQMEAALAALRQEPTVDIAIQDAMVQPDRITEGNAGFPDWEWEVEPAGGNWGLELIRVPQMWNLHTGVVRDGDQTVITGVLDAGVTSGHEDLSLEANLSPGVSSSHGTHVAGTIAAGFNNGTGVDGVNPFARVVGIQEVHYLYSFYTLIKSRPDVQVINNSMGYSWAVQTNPRDSNTDQLVQALMDQQGAVFVAMQNLLLSEVGRLPLLVVSAGNASDTPFGTQLAKYNSQPANAALVHGANNIIIVENVELDLSAPGRATREPSSNVSGHLSAPGTGIWSTDTVQQKYSEKTGTSMAAPHVAGLAGFLLAVDPNLSNGQLRDLLLSNTVPVGGGASPRIDAFAAVLGIDVVRGNNRVLRMLLDVDDGTEDGNRRTAPDAPQTDYTGDDPAADCDALGSCRIDMADFRRFRDALLQIENTLDHVLDGSANHPKKDLNSDGTVGLTGPGAGEVFPRADFNGDGDISRADAVRVPGFEDSVTDLDVLQRLFSDHHYDKAHLPELLTSADIAIHSERLQSEFPSAQIHSSVRPVDTDASQEDPRFRRLHTGNPQQGERPWQVYTVATSQAAYIGRLVVVSAAGDTLAQMEKSFDVKPGQDHYWNPGRIEVTIVPTSVTLEPGETQQFTAVVSGTDVGGVTWTTAGGTITTGGLYTAGSAPGIFVVRASAVADPVAHGDAIVTIVSPPGALEWRFDTDLEGWSCNSTNNCKWQLLTSNQFPQTSGWVALQSNGAAVSRTIALPSTARFLRFDAATHNVPGDVSRVQVQVGGVVVLDSVFVNPGSNTAFNFVTMTVDISSRAGQTMNIRFVQLDDGNGGGTTLKIDNIRIEPN